MGIARRVPTSARIVAADRRRGSDAPAHRSRASVSQHPEPAKARRRGPEADASLDWTSLAGWAAVAASSRPPAPARSPPGKQRIVAAGGIVAVALTLLGSLHFFNATFDDAFISFRYAANLVAGHGLVFNPGERVEGYTNFLWTVALSLPTWLGAGRDELGMLLVAKLCGVGLNVLTVALLAGTARGGPEDEDRWPLPLAALYAATCAPYLFWGVGALETPLVTFLLVAALVRFDRELSAAPPRRGSAVLILGAALTRPEPVLLAGTLVLLRWCYRDRAAKAPWADSARYLATFAGPYAAFLAFRWWYYGQLLPNTYYAKVYGDRFAQSRGLQYVAQAIADLNWTALLLVSVACILLGRRWSRRVTVLVTALVVHVAGVVYEGGDWMPAGRMLIPIVPVVGLLVQEGWMATRHFAVGVPSPPVLPAWVAPPQWVAGARRGARWLAHAPWYPRAVALARRGTQLSLIVALVLGVRGSFGAIRVRGLESGFDRIHLDNFQHFEVARWMRRELKDGGLLAIGEAGVIPYYTGLPVLDMFGLMDPHIAHLKGVLHIKFDPEYVLDREPRYVFLVFVVHPNGGRVPSHRHGAILLKSPRFLREYSVAQDFGTSVLYARTRAVEPAR
jgi:arabinofuranosyltransferase